MFFLTSHLLGLAWPLLTNESLAEVLFLNNKKAASQEEKDFVLPFSPVTTYLECGEEIQKRGCHLVTLRSQA